MIRLKQHREVSSHFCFIFIKTGSFVYKKWSLKVFVVLVFLDFHQSLQVQFVFVPVDVWLPVLFCSCCPASCLSHLLMIKPLLLSSPPPSNFADFLKYFFVTLIQKNSWNDVNKSRIQIIIWVILICSNYSKYICCFLYVAPLVVLLCSGD